MLKKLQWYIVLVLLLIILAGVGYWDFFVRGPSITSVSRLPEDEGMLIIELNGPPFMGEKMRNFEYSPIRVVSGDRTYDPIGVVGHDGAYGTGTMTVKFANVPRDLPNPVLHLADLPGIPFQEQAPPAPK